MTPCCSDPLCSTCGGGQEYREALVNTIEELKRRVRTAEAELAVIDRNQCSETGSKET